MYQKEMRKIQAGFAAQPGETLEQTVRFVLATIQQQFSTVEDILHTWALQGEMAPTMWGAKRKGVRYIEKHSQELAAKLKGCDTVEAVDTLLTVPGLNTVKASFVAQCLGFGVGCIDTHNARIHGVNVKSYAVTKNLTAKTRLAKIKSYIALCQGLGGSAVLWDSWCELIADKQSAHFDDAEAVSAYHSHCILKHVKHDPARW